MIPPEALKEYELKNHENVLMMSRHKLSGGFDLIFTGIVEGLLGINDKFAEHPLSEGEIEETHGKFICWVCIRDGLITVPVETLEKYSVYPGNYLLSVKESFVILTFLVKGPLVKEAQKHELPVYE
ncbi:MAG: hypothetical protein HXS54_06620 [Theionarchaea archaeon]|nr:hypothetical protein [Theionarchaea archaeon]